MLEVRLFGREVRFGKRRSAHYGFPSLLLVTLPKSGSIFIRRALSDSLGLKIAQPSPGYFPVDHLSVRAMKILARGGCIGQTHIDPSPLNLGILDHYKPICLLHLRDPRSALLSWVHHVDRLRNERPEKLLYSPPRLPEEYGSMGFEEKLDWQINHYYPQMIEWIERWVKVVDERSDIVVTTFGQMHNRDESFIRELIGKLYGKELPGDIKLPAKTLRSHFRSGRRDEWLEVFSREQINRTTRMIPASLRQRFNWPDVEQPLAKAAGQTGNCRCTARA